MGEPLKRINVGPLQLRRFAKLIAISTKEEKTPVKAAVLHTLGKPPRFEDFPDPHPSPDEMKVRVKAASLKNIDKAMASGSHYDSKGLTIGIEADDQASLGRFAAHRVRRQYAPDRES